MTHFGETIPVIDLKEVSNEMLNQKIREASEKWGCFRVINHGVPVELMSEMKKTVEEFFDRPYEVKLQNTNVLQGRGYKSPDEINPFHESLGFYDMASSEAVNTFCDQLNASADQRETMIKYAKAINDLAKDLARRLAESYSVNTDSFKGWPMVYQINKYYLKPETAGRSNMRLHTNSAFLTILQDDHENVGGLEAMDNSSGTCFPINPLPNTLVVNLGEMATIWSNGRLCSVKHKVQCKEAKFRISISSFLLGPVDANLEAPDEFVDAEHPRLYKPISQDELHHLRRTSKRRDGQVLLKLITMKDSSK